MKILNGLWILVIGVICFSCSDNDENTGSTASEKIVGSWNLGNRIINGEEVGIEYCELQTNIQFFEDGNLKANISIGDNPDDCQSFSRSGEYSFQDENTIMVDIAGNSSVVDVAFPEGNQVLEIIDTSDGNGIDKDIYFR